jgi:hypothetical protein
MKVVVVDRRRAPCGASGWDRTDEAARRTRAMGA